jgi:hypothetical protein
MGSARMPLAEDETGHRSLLGEKIHDKYQFGSFFGVLEIGLKM